MSSYRVDDGDVCHIVPEEEALEWEREGHKIHKLAPPKSGFAPSRVYNIPVALVKAMKRKEDADE